jgi:hypothetical protein
VINAPQLLADLTRLLKRLEDDLRQRLAEVTELKASLQAEWQAARDADRTAETFEAWADQVITQAGVHWLLSCVFLRFVEDNELVERPWLGGTPDSGRLALARDRHEAYFRERPLESDRDYLLTAFHEAGTLPGLYTFFDEAHNPVFRLGLSGDAAMALRQFWQQVDPNTGTLAHDLTDPDWNTRFLGDLYQDLSEAARKRYALLQTPDFVEEFILDRTLTPAICEFGFREVRMIDPTCGSGHFLLGAFQRLVAEWVRHEPGRNSRDVAQRALDAVAGVDLNPCAVAISRFRLLVAALKVSGVHHLSDAPDFKLNVAVGDSLLHGKRFGMTDTEGMFESAEHYAGTGLAHAYVSEDLGEVQLILGRQYHAVVGNPPYIVVKDAALNSAYRQRYASCHRKYSLGAPFTERFFDLAVGSGAARPAGYIGLITTNSFMKREFGSKLIEKVLPKLDLTHVVDTSGAYIPGHGTPTVILFGRNRPPVAESVRTVMGIKGEPSMPDDPAHGQVWSAIVDQIDRAGSESEFVSVTDTSRRTFGHHPWSIGGGGASDLLDTVSEAGERKLATIVAAVGRTTHTGEDGAFFVPRRWAERAHIDGFTLPLVEGEFIRDFAIDYDLETIFPYDRRSASVLTDLPQQLWRHLWTYRRLLKERSDFGNYIEDRGLRWYEHSMFFPERFRARIGIAFAFVSTHNHFAIERGGMVFKQSAPVIKLQANATEDDHFGLLGLLNSSVGCFWCQQVCHNKGGPGGGSSKDEKWHDFYEFSSTALGEFPLTEIRPVDLARQLDGLAREWAETLPMSLLARAAEGSRQVPTRADLVAAREHAKSIRRQMIAWQEELDWQCYGLYGVLPSSDKSTHFTHGSPPEVELGERAFEIVMARRVAQGSLETRWFEWLGIAPRLDIPNHLPEGYRRVVARRIELIESDRNIGLCESMNCKRRWEAKSWADQERAALFTWLQDRLESQDLWPASVERPPQITTTSRLADGIERDVEFMQIAELYAGHADFDVAQLVAELVAADSVPFLPALRYSNTGLRKRAQWEATWELQRREDIDEGTSTSTIPVPPKYQSKDFLNSDFWRLRGGLDVPKERWVSYPGCERGADTSLPIAWAGWNHLQQATALAAYYLEMKESEGWVPLRLQPMLAGLLQLVPWLEQWHNELDPAYGERMGTYYRGFVNEEARGLGFTLDDLRAWKPAVAGAKRSRKKASQPL